MFNIILLVALLFVGNAFAVNMGVGSTGGGNVVVCGNKVELLDLYEARHKFNRSISEISGDPEKMAKKKALDLAVASLPERDSIVILAASFVAPYLRFEIGLDSMYRTLHFLDDSASMPDPNDIGEVPELPAGCFIKRLAAFHVNGDVFVRKTLFEGLSTVDKAAMFMHEYLYKGLKESDLLLNDQETVFTSEHIRYVNGLLFSDESLSRRFINFPEKDDYIALCISPNKNFQFILYPDSQSQPGQTIYRQEYFIIDGKFTYLEHNKEIGNIPEQYEFIYSRMCHFLINGAPWSSH